MVSGVSYLIRADLKRIIVLVGSGCCDKGPQTGRLKHQKLIFLTVLEAGSHDRGDGRLVPGESPLHGLQMVLSWLCLTHRVSSLVSPLIRTLIL